MNRGTLLFPAVKFLNFLPIRSSVILYGQRFDQFNVLGFLIPSDPLADEIDKLFRFQGLAGF